MSPVILIVDDEPMNRELLHAFLDGGEYVVMDAGSGEEALEVASGSPPDLVLMDVMMPGMSGFEATRLLKEQCDTFLPVILLTSLSDRASRLRGLDAGADEFLTKPIDREELGVRIRNLLALRSKEMLLARRNVALMELNRFRDEMSALLVHDLKNPMTVILSNHDFVASRLNSVDPLLSEALEDSRHASKQVLRILANLLDLARLETSHLHVRRAPTRLVSLIEGVIRARGYLARARGVEIRVDVALDLALDVDADLLTRVVENIVDNAFRYVPANGRIEVRARAADDEVRVEIGNSGPAIPVEARSVIFEKFGQATSNVGRMNLGLGLYFCRLALEAHGGQIFVEDAPGLPTMFVLRLPVAALANHALPSA